MAWCVGRVLVGVGGSPGYGVLFSMWVFGMSVEIAVYWIGTGVFISGEISLNLNVR